MGKTEVFFDGIFHVPTWRTSEGQWQSKAARDGGVDPHMAPQTLRLGNGTSTSPNNKDACVNDHGMPLHKRSYCLVCNTCMAAITDWESNCEDVSSQHSCCALVICYQHPFPVMLEASLPLALRAMLSIAYTRHHTSRAQGILLTELLRMMVTTSAAYRQGWGSSYMGRSTMRPMQRASSCWSMTCSNSVKWEVVCLRADLSPTFFPTHYCDLQGPWCWGRIRTAMGAALIPRPALMGTWLMCASGTRSCLRYSCSLSFA